MKIFFVALNIAGLSLLSVFTSCGSKASTTIGDRSVYTGSNGTNYGGAYQSSGRICGPSG
ncbi:MAG: hypothetical protein P1V20_06685 [Verrucomicrobiales bacterium]|nr:hypothetical protein [Verrucomicrobiales bacterium]